MRHLTLVVICIFSFTLSSISQASPQALSSSITTIPSIVNLEKVVVFGDSLSDNGNVYQTTKTAAWLAKQMCEKFGIGCDLKVPIIPKSPPYFQGRFSNAEVWSEQLASLLNLSKTVTQFRDYAYGGAWATSPEHGGKGITPSLELQLSTYFALYGNEKGKVDNYLFIIWAGGNDYLADRKESVDVATSKAILSIQTQVDRLVEYGAKNILFLNLPDLGKTPYAFSLPSKAKRMTDMSTTHNKKLHDLITKERSAHPAIKFIEFDTMFYFNELTAHSFVYNIKNIKTACYPGGYSQAVNNLLALTPNPEHSIEVNTNALKLAIMNNVDLKEAYSNGLNYDAGVEPCKDPDTYLYWDGVHPTGKVHKLLANQVYALLKNSLN